MSVAIPHAAIEFVIMIEEIQIRESQPSDEASIESLYPDAFPDEELLPLVRELLSAKPICLSLVGIVERALVGHAIFTACRIGAGPENVSLLGPLAVVSDLQRQGVGSALVREGFLRLKRSGAVHVYVLGDPAYYRRFGFQPEADVVPPYPLPAEWRGAWQSVSLNSDDAPAEGKLTVPPQWRQPALWAP